MRVVRVAAEYCGKRTVSTGADGSADELRSHRFRIETNVIGRNVANKIGVDVARYDNGVDEIPLGEKIQDFLPVHRIAVPLFSAKISDGRIGVCIIWCERHLIGKEVPVGSGLSQTFEQPCLLRRAFYS